MLGSTTVECFKNVLIKRHLLVSITIFQGTSTYFVPRHIQRHAVKVVLELSSAELSGIVRNSLSHDLLGVTKARSKPLSCFKACLATQTTTYNEIGANITVILGEPRHDSCSNLIV